MYELLNITQSQTNRGKEKWRFSIRFLLSGNLGSYISHGWRYFPHNDQLFTPQIGNTYAKSGAATEELKAAVKETIARYVLYRNASMDVAAVVERGREILSEEATPLAAFRRVSRETANKTLTPGQFALLVGLAIHADLATKDGELIVPIESTEEEDDEDDV